MVSLKLKISEGSKAFFKRFLAAPLDLALSHSFAQLREEPFIVLGKSAHSCSLLQFSSKLVRIIITCFFGIFFSQFCLIVITMFSMTSSRTKLLLTKKYTKEFIAGCNISEIKKYLSQGMLEKGVSLNKHYIRSFSESGVPWTSNLISSNQKVDNFINTFPDIVKDLTSGSSRRYIPEVITHYSEFIHYVVPNSKYLRGFLTIATIEILEKQENLSPEKIRLANVMGWIMEILHAFFATADDIIDNSEIRRGLPCWYKKQNVGSTAINDGILLEQGVYVLLKKHFCNHHFYLPVMELIHDITLQTSMGEALDCKSVKNGKPNFEIFTLEKFKYVTDYATTYYTFYLPIASAMYMTSLYDIDLHKETKIMCRKIGRLHKMQEDFKDCFGDSVKTGKKGNDIQEGKLNWFSAMALQIANSSQKDVMEKYYGRPDLEATNKILDLYKELKLPGLYNLSLKETYNSIRTHIHTFSKNENLKKLFIKITDTLYEKKH